MIRSRLTTVLFGLLTGVAIVLTVAAPAEAVTVDQQLSVMSNWSQPNSGSYNAWNTARQNQGSWADYGFDWSTDYCSSSPDQPLGFDFRLSCYRHDFGYRNFKAVGAFDPNKSRIDDSFYFDLKSKCATYNAFVRPACYSLAWTYYEAVRTFGTVAAVSQVDLDRAAAIKADGLARQAASTS
jgi:hypothetical protein